MLNGDISNRESPVLAFNIDSLLFTNKLRKDGLIDKLKYKVGSEKYRYLNRELDKTFVNSILTLWDKFNYSIYFVTQQPFKSDIEELLAEMDVCYTRLVYYDDILDMRQAVFNRFTYYFDTNEETISILSSSKAVPFSTLWEKVGRA